MTKEMKIDFHFTYFSVILEKMNNDYKTTLNTHNAEQDLSWWDQNYGRCQSCFLIQLLNLVFSSFFFRYRNEFAMAGI